MNLPVFRTTIDADHYLEWQLSGVSEAIIDRNVISIQPGVHAYDFIGSEHMDRRNDGRLTSYWLKKYSHVEDGGWWCAGVDPDAPTKRMEWGCLKPNTPYFDEKRNRYRKYDHPFGAERRIFLLQTEDESLWSRATYDTTIDLTITEGAKKAGCLLTNDKVAIGLPGINAGVRKDESSGRKRFYLVPDLQKFTWTGRKVFILFDYSAKVSSRHDVDRETKKLAEQLKKRGAAPYVVTLPGPEKGVDDFVMARGVEALQSLYDEALPLEAWEIQQYNRLTYPATHVNQRYLDVKIPKTGLVGIKSPKGTGKTEQIARVVSELLDDAKRILFVTHRKQLGEALGARVRLPYVTELGSVGERDLFGYILCADSMVRESQARFSPEGWDAVIIDECEQVLWHILDSSTEIEKRRIPVLENLQYVLRDQLQNSQGLVALMDADLTDISIDFVKELAGTPELEPTIIQNDWKPQAEAWRIHHYEHSNPESLYAKTIELLDDGKKLIIFTHSQQPKGRLSTRTLEKQYRKRYPNRKILRVDSKTISDSSHAAFGCMAHLNQLLLEYDIVICSPSIETGVSIDIRGHFDAVIGFFQGVSTTDGARQSLSRVRDPIDRYLWIAKRSLTIVDNGATSAQELLDSQRKKTTYHVKQLAHLAEVDLHDEATETTSPLKTWAKIGARINAGNQKYRETIINGLVAEGHQIVGMESAPDVSLSEELTQTRDQAYQEQCEAIANAEEITPSKYEELKSKNSKSEEEWNQQRKHFLQQRYQVKEVTPELVKKDDQNWFKHIRMHYYMTFGKPYLNQREVSTFSNAIINGKVWQPTMNRSQLSLKLALLEFLGIRRLMNPETVYHKDQEDVLAVTEAAIANRWLVRSVLGVSVSEKVSNMQICQSLLGLIGIRLVCGGRPGERGEKRNRLYSYARPEDDRWEIFARWQERDELKRTEAAVSTPSINKYSGELEGVAA